MNSMMKLLVPSVCLALAACAADPVEPELVIHNADESGVTGEYRTADSVVRFESRAVGTDVAAAFFDEQDVRLATTFPGKTPPADWGVAAGPDHNPDRAALDLIPEVARALAAEGLPAADALVTLGSPPTGTDPVTPEGGSHGRCDRYVEYEAYSFTGYPCHQALSYLQRRYAECSVWVRYSWKYYDYQQQYSVYYCTAAATY